MENTIEKKVKTKKWQQYKFQIAGVAEQVEEEEEEMNNSMSKFCLSLSIFVALWNYPFYSKYKLYILNVLTLILLYFLYMRPIYVFIREQVAHDVRYRYLLLVLWCTCMLTANGLLFFHFRVKIKCISCSY